MILIAKCNKTMRPNFFGSGKDPEKDFFNFQKKTLRILKNTVLAKKTILFYLNFYKNQKYT